MAEREFMSGHPSGLPETQAVSGEEFEHAGAEESSLDLYLKLAEECVERVQNMPSRKFNDKQCEYLADKLKVVVQIARSFLQIPRTELHGSCSSADIARWVSIFKLLLAFAKEIESFIQSCCKDEWIQAAMTLMNVSEYVSSVGFKLELCRVTFCKECAATGSLTLDQVDDINKAEVEVVEKKASVDAETLFEKVILESNSLRSENRDLAAYLLQRLKRVKPIPASLSSGSSSSWSVIDDGGLFGKLFKRVQQTKLLGRGAAATMHKAMWLGTRVAKKTFQGRENPDFMKEVDILSRLCHPNITSMFCCAMDKRNCSIIMELMDGDLHDFMCRRCDGNSDSPPFFILEAVDIMLQIGEGVNYLHNERIVHRDLKSMNILVKSVKARKSEIGYVHVKVADFGLSKTKDSSIRFSSQTCNTGTNRWMPPKIINLPNMDSQVSTSGYGKVPRYPFKCDVYSFGMVCYEILTGYEPFPDERSPKNVKEKVMRGERPDLPDHCPLELKALIKKCWNQVPKEDPSFADICLELKYLKCLLMTGFNQGSHLTIEEPLQAEAVVPVGAVDYVAMETSSETKKCVLCHRKKDDKKSSMCWIALVQRYNFPCQVLKRGKPVANISDLGPVPNFGQFHEVNLGDEGLDQLVTVGFPDNSGVATAMDFSTVEHVQCCGHQMHFDCFQGHMKNLQLSRHAGNGVADPGKAEFSCPTCGRLANVLLPAVDASLSFTELDMHENGKGVEETGKFWSRFWQSNENLERAADSFCCQMLRVQEQSPQSFFNLRRFELSQALWEGLVLNVIHCEVETRDGYVKGETASSVSAPIKVSGECTWGGDAAHWIALRELGRLAMLSNTLPGAVQGRDQMLRRLKDCLGLLGTSREITLPRESDTISESSPNWAGISELEKIIREMFPQNSLVSVEPSELLHGKKLMEFISLQLALQLPDCAQVLQSQVHGFGKTLATQLLILHQPVSKTFTFELRKVPPKAMLHRLPRDFQELLLEYIHNKKQCSACGKMPADPAICLICGVLLCCGTDCCRSPTGIGECSQHAADESAGVGIFLLLRSTQLLLLRNNRTYHQTYLGLSLYLDIHGALLTTTYTYCTALNQGLASIKLHLSVDSTAMSIMPDDGRFHSLGPTRLDSNSDKNGQPSPVSVLEAPFEEESPTLEFKEIANSLQGQEADLAFVSDILVSSGFIAHGGSTISRWHSATRPISHRLFAKASYSDRQGSLHRRNLFDAINEILAGKLGPPCYGPWLQLSAMCNATAVRTGRRLVEDVWTEILMRQFPARCDHDLHNDYLESLVAQDLKTSTSWMWLQHDVDCICLQVEKAIFNDLMKELCGGLLV